MPKCAESSGLWSFFLSFLFVCFVVVVVVVVFLNEDEKICLTISILGILMKRQSLTPMLPILMCHLRSFSLQFTHKAIAWSSSRYSELDLGNPIPLVNSYTKIHRTGIFCSDCKMDVASSFLDVGYGGDVFEDNSAKVWGNNVFWHLRDSCYITKDKV